MVYFDYRPRLSINPSRLESTDHTALTVDADTQKPVARISFSSLND
jgi:hypothetical protein